MFVEINKRIEEALEGVYRLQKIDSILEELKQEETSLENKISELKIIMDKENLDLKNLENKSLANIFYSVLGNLEDRIEKERREALAARFKYDQGVRDLTSVKRKIAGLASERPNYKDCPSKYKDLYNQKKELLLKSNAMTAQKILDITEKISFAKNNLREIDEAIVVGRKVVDSLQNALSSLGSAGNWGLVDMLGGGLLTDIIKHNHIDEARSEVQETHSLLRQFKTELTDIKINSDITIETEGFTKFADFFFDGLISDWFMQSKIQNSQESVERVESQVQSVLTNLENLEGQETSNIKKLTEEINHLITSA